MNAVEIGERFSVNLRASLYSFAAIDPCVQRLYPTPRALSHRRKYLRYKSIPAACEATMRGKNHVEQASGTMPICRTHNHMRPFSEASRIPCQRHRAPMPLLLRR